METKKKVTIGITILAVFAVLAFSGVVEMTGKSLGTKQCTNSKGINDDMYERSTITGVQANGIKYLPKTDYCSAENPNILVEFGCGGESGWTRDTIYCNNGCSNGACIKGSINDGRQIFN